VIALEALNTITRPSAIRNATDPSNSGSAGRAARLASGSADG
jgi:hypothetical protein